MKQYDVIIIGGGVLGCFAARNLQRWQISAALLEAKEDVCTGITRANTAIVYAGYDNKPGSLKAQMTVRGNASFDELCRELDVPFSRCGSLMVSYGPQADKVLQKKLEDGRQNGVPELTLLSGIEAMQLEPMLAEGVSSALYAPSTGTVNPWQLGIAAYENAVHNGCEAYFNSRVTAIHKQNDGYMGYTGGYTIETNDQTFHCKMILNCAGLAASHIQELLFPPSVRLFCDGADFLVLDKFTDAPKHIIFQQTEDNGKGITAVPTVEGNLLIGPSQRPLDNSLWATTTDGIAFLKQGIGQILPEVDLTNIIRSFAAVRPNPHRMVLKDGQYVPDGRSIGSFVIEHPAPDFYSLIGIKTPGLTCANELGMYLAEKAADYLKAGKNPAFSLYRKAIAKQSGEVICRCEQISRGEIEEAINRGADTVDGVKRRTGAGMGRCQGSRCRYAIENILAEKLLEREQNEKH